MKTKINFPTMLTLSRFVAALLLPLFFAFASMQTAAMWGFVIFVAGALTDYIDGYLARKWNQTSELGRMLDPIADKIMVLIVLAIILGMFGNQWTLVLPISVIIFREVLVSGMREFLGDRAKALQVTQLAKWKTMTQMVAISSILLAVAMSSDILMGLGVIALWIAAILTAITGADYARKAVGLLND